MPIRPINRAPYSIEPVLSEDMVSDVPLTPAGVVQVRSRTRVVSANDGAPVEEAIAANDSSAPRERIPAKSKAAKIKAGKKQPTGDYAVGYCKPPLATRFDGSRPGPGRPPGALSQDTLLKKHLTQVRPVAIEGKQTKMQNRELVLMMRMKEALSGNRHAADYVLTQAARLFSERADAEGKGAALLPDDAHDRAILEALEAALLARALGDGVSVEEDLGDEPSSDGDGANGEDRS